MAITRTPIIDDDGTGTTGTVIDNAWKTELYNQIDAAGVPAWANVGYNAAAFYAKAPMGWAVEAGDLIANWYTVTGKVVTWGVNILSSSTTGSASETLYAVIPAAITPALNFRAHGRIYTPTTGWVDCDIQNGGPGPNGPAISIGFYDLTPLPIAANGIFLNFTIQIPY